MTQYIDKSALVAEIKNLENTYKKCPTRNSYEDGLKDGRLIGYKDALYKIDTLEVKEVDREKEFDVIIDSLNDDKYEHLSIHQQLSHIAKHFYELGLQVNNPVTAADRGFAEEIIVNLKRVENDYHLDLTREMEWLRNKTKKGE